MYLYTCHPCLEGHHEHFHGTQYPPKGQFGGSKCDCNCKAVKPEPVEATSTCNTCGYSWNTLAGGLHCCESIMIERIKDLEQSKQHLVAELLESNRLLKADAAQIQQLGNEIARLNGQTNFFCQYGGVKPELTYKPNLNGPAKHRCETCREEGTIHIKPIGCHFCQSCLTKIDARIAEINSAKP